jgi:hypothetical protein
MDPNERLALAGLEISATGGLNRLFQIRLEDKTVIYIAIQGVSHARLEVVPVPPTNTQINEAIGILASARALG